VFVCEDAGGGGLTQLTGDTADESDQDDPHSGSQSLSQKVCCLPSHLSHTTALASASHEGLRCKRAVL